MAKPSSELLRKDIIDILKDADLTTMSSKKVRYQLSKKYGCDLQSRKEEIDRMIMDVISQESSDDVSKATASTSSKPTAQKTANSRSKQSAVNDDDDVEDVSDEEMNSAKDSDSDSDELADELLARKLQEEESASIRKKARKPAAPPKSSKSKSEKSKDESKPKRITRYNEPLELSPELAAIVGEPRLPRHAVVKKMWEIVRERNLFDPKNKQFMICDDQLLTVFGKKKVRAFGMMKYLCQHMSSPNSATKRRK